MADKINIGQKAFEWLKTLNPEIEQSDDKNKGDRAVMARLRRASTLPQVLTHKQTYDLVYALGFLTDHKPMLEKQKLSLTDKQVLRLEKIAVIAGVLASVRKHEKRSFPQKLGASGKGDMPVMSPMRFSRLMTARTPEDLMNQMRQAIRLADNTANVREIAEFIYYWGDSQKVKWTYAYWQSTADAPQNDKQNNNKTK